MQTDIKSWAVYGLERDKWLFREARWRRRSPVRQCSDEKKKRARGDSRNWTKRQAKHLIEIYVKEPGGRSSRTTVTKKVAIAKRCEREPRAIPSTSWLALFFFFFYAYQPYSYANPLLRHANSGRSLFALIVVF